jgi:hypothetical protein
VESGLESATIAIAIEWIEKWSPAKATGTANSTASGLDNEIPNTVFDFSSDV